MNMFKKNGGFTLVELIVVIAILAILAGIAVPAYSGYIAKANDAADTTALGAVKTAALAAWATTGSVDQIVVEAAEGDGVVTAVKIKGNGTEEDASGYVTLYSVTTDTNENEKSNWKNTDFETYLNENMIELKGDTFKKGAVWTTAKGWVAHAECADGDDDDAVCDVCGGAVAGTNGGGGSGET